MGPAEIAIIVLVVGLRLFVPLTIPYFPLVGVVTCLVLDSADQSIFQQFPAIPLDGYQSYDKALDIYYLTITYLSTLRNWVNQPAFRVSQVLFFYRLVGVAAFELTQVRALLLIFPNTFEYFFIFVELVRTRWETSRLSAKMAVVAAALIWVFIKLPQEWWIHIAKLDMTDFIKQQLFAVDPSASWGAAIANAPWVLAAIIVALAALGAAVWWTVTHRAPPADHSPRLRADALPPALQGAELYRRARAGAGVFTTALLEKTVLLALVSIIFASMLSGVTASALQVATSVTMFVVLNAAVSHWLASRGRGWRTVALEFATMAVINFGLAIALEIAQRFLGLRDVGVSLQLLLFFVYLLTIMIVLFDRFHTVYEARRTLKSMTLA